MYELEGKIQKLIEWTKEAYGISTKEAIRSIEKKLNELNK